MVVDLPAPFGPSRATVWPVATSKLTSRSASSRPYRLLRCSTVIALIGPGPAPGRGGRR
jgi:hypothetical protein